MLLTLYFTEENKKKKKVGADRGEDYRERNLEMAQKSTFCLRLPGVYIYEKET